MYLLLQEASIEQIPVCRLCGTQTVSCVDPFAESNRYMVFAIQKHLDIEIGEKENCPKTVCQICSQKVEEFDEFYNKCNKMQSLFLETPVLVQNVTAVNQNGESSSLNVPDSVSNHLTRLVEELVQDGSLSVEQTVEPPSPEDEPSHEVQTEDEFEDAPSSDEEDPDGEPSEDLSDSQPSTSKPRQKKFVFTIPFLEKKIGKSFTPSEKNKLQKFINKRNNTLICKSIFHQNIVTV